MIKLLQAPDLPTSITTLQLLTLQICHKILILDFSEVEPVLIATTLPSSFKTILFGPIQENLQLTVII